MFIIPFHLIAEPSRLWQPLATTLSERKPRWGVYFTKTIVSISVSNFFGCNTIAHSQPNRLANWLAPIVLGSKCKPLSCVGELVTAEIISYWWGPWHTLHTGVAFSPCVWAGVCAGYAFDWSTFHALNNGTVWRATPNFLVECSCIIDTGRAFVPGGVSGVCTMGLFYGMGELMARERCFSPEGPLTGTTLRGLFSSLPPLMLY